MKEIEILVEVYDDINIVKKVFDKYEYVGLKHIIDEYYYDPKRNDLKPDINNQLSNCLRLRNKNNEYFITYKNDVFDELGKWLYSNEYETKLESIDIIKEIFSKLGLKKFIEIDSEKETYKTDNYEITLESVKELGLFIEIEYSTNEDVDIKYIKREIQTFIDNLNINVSDELNMGKPEMYLRKHNIKID